MYAILLNNKNTIWNYSRFFTTLVLGYTLNITENSSDFKILFKKKKESSLNAHNLYILVLHVTR